MREVAAGLSLCVGSTPFAFLTTGIAWSWVANVWCCPQHPAAWGQPGFTSCSMEPPAQGRALWPFSPQLGPGDRECLGVLESEFVTFIKPSNKAIRCLGSDSARCSVICSNNVFIFGQWYWLHCEYCHSFCLATCSVHWQHNKLSPWKIPPPARYLLHAVLTVQ